MPYKNKEDKRLCDIRYSKTKKYKISQKKYRMSEQGKKHKREYAKRQRIINPNTKLLNTLRSRICLSIKRDLKSDTTKNLTGCSIEQLKKYLQQTAINNGYKDFNINNYNGREYHIDHIVPCDAFNLNCSYHQRLCFNYQNLQILDSHSNLVKLNRML